MKYTLIIGAKSNPNHAADWLAGSITAHWFQYKKERKTSWFSSLKLRGVLEEDKNGSNLKENIEYIRNQIKGSYGYFCDVKNKKISWRFKIEDILSIDEMKKLKHNYEKYVPFFRREVYPPYGGNSKDNWENCYWFILSDLKILKNPISANDLKFPDFKIYKGKYNRRLVTLSTNDFIGNTAFVVECPKITDRHVEEYCEDRAFDSYLKKFFLYRPPEERLRERIIQEFFIMRLMEKGRMVWKEVKDGKKGRIDVLFKKNNKYVAVEIKRDYGDDALDQLKKYITESEKKYGESIEGMIICGELSDELKKAAKRENYKIVEYKLSMDIPI